LWEGRDDIGVGEAEEIEHAHTFIHKNKSLLTYTHNTTHSLTQTDRQKYLRSTVYDAQQGVPYDLYTPGRGPLVHTGLGYKV
jgi:hypothetical protein